MKWWDRMPWSSLFWMFSFSWLKTFIKRPFSSSSLSAIRVVSSVYLSLLIFLPEILIPACASSSPAFHMMYSAYKLNKQGDNTQKSALKWSSLPSPWCELEPQYQVLYSLYMGIPPCSSTGKGSACNAGDVGLIPGLGRSCAEGNGNPLHYSCLQNPMDKGAW